MGAPFANESVLYGKEVDRLRRLIKRMRHLAERIAKRDAAGLNADYDRGEFAAIRWMFRMVAPEDKFPSFYPLPAYSSCRQRHQVDSTDGHGSAPSVVP